MIPIIPTLMRRAALMILGGIAGAIVRDATREQVDEAWDDVKKGARGIVKDIQKDIQKNPPIDHRKAGLEPGKVKKK